MLQIELTNICNHKCYFCSSRLIEQNTTIDINTFKNIVNDAVELGIKKLFLTPAEGEIFMIDNIIEYLTFASKIIKIEFVTNFVPLNRDQIIELSKLKNCNIIISNYGNNDSEMFKFMTQSSISSYNKFQKNIKFAQELNINLNIERRDLTYDFSYDNTNDNTLKDKYKTKTIIKKDRNIIKHGVCNLLNSPRILSNGDFALCRCSGGYDNIKNTDLIIGNIYKDDFKKLMFHPLRYKKFKEQSNNIYTNYCDECTSFSKTKENISLNNLKIYSKIKRILNGEVKNIR